MNVVDAILCIEEGVFLMKGIIRKVFDFAMKKNKIVFPVAVIAAVAVTVLVALNANGKKAERVEELTANVPSTEVAEEQSGEQLDYTKIALMPNENQDINSLITTYYNAIALGDVETLQKVCDTIDDEDMIRFEETAKYLESYPVIEIYTKTGYANGETIAYVYYKVLFSGKETQIPGYKALYICTDDQGSLYIKRDNFDEATNDYIKTLSAQADVVEFNNRVTVEYNDIMVAQPELLEYLSEVNNEVLKVTGVMLAQQIANENETAEGENTEGGADEGVEQTQESQPEQGETPVENVTLFASATTTVNVRSSDSEQADKLGKVSGGTKLQVLEQRQNGWNKVLFEGQEGYIKAEYLQILENVEGTEAIGLVTATTTVNVRAQASEDAEKLGLLAGAETAELIARENDWCKIKFGGQIGYVKAEFVQ